MKKKFLFFILFFLIYFPCVSALDINSDEYFSWLVESDFIVKDSNYETYSSTYNGIKKGSVFLDYGRRDNAIYRPRELIISTALMGDSLLYAYDNTKDNSYLNLAKLVGDHIINDCLYEHKYPREGDDKPILTFVASMLNMNGSSWKFSDTPEIHMNGMLFTPWFLLELSNATGEEKYATTALKIIDSVIYIQQKYDRSGGVPDFLYFYDSTGASWYASLDVAWPYYLAFSEAYSYTNDNKYKESMDNYFNFVFDALENKSGTFTFNKGEIDYILPYEKVADYGLNCDNYDGSLKVDNDFTTDQLFYTVLGLVSYDKDNYYSKEFLKSIRAISIEESKFYGEYTINGEKGSHAETTIESANTGFYLELLRSYDEDKDIINDIFQNVVLAKRLVAEDKNANGAYYWDFDTDDAFVVESLATAVLLKSGYKSKLYIDERTPVEEEQEKPKEEAVEEKEEIILNPDTGAFTNYLLIISSISISLIIIVNILKRTKFYRI